MKQEQVWDKIAPKWVKIKTFRNDLTDEFLKAGKGKKVIDLGCGSGRNFIKTTSIIYGVDFSKEMLALAKENAKKKKINVKLKKSNVWETGFKGNFFDSGICVSVLHSIKSKAKRKKTIKEFYRILKPNAKAFVSVWNKTSRRLKNKDKQHKLSWNVDGEKVWRDTYIYDYDELKKELEKVGFKILKKFENRNNIMVVVVKRIIIKFI